MRGEFTPTWRVVLEVTSTRKWQDLSPQRFCFMKKTLFLNQNLIFQVSGKEEGPPTLFFAGEATHGEHPATMHGAILSGIREARRIRDVLREGKIGEGRKKGVAGQGPAQTCYVHVEGGLNSDGEFDQSESEAIRPDTLSGKGPTGQCHDHPKKIIGLYC